MDAELEHKCKNCKWWNAIHPTENTRVFAICANPKMLDEYYNPMYLYFPADFGCIYWEAK